jgi:hypothetical protein
MNLRRNIYNQCDEITQAHLSKIKEPIPYRMDMTTSVFDEIKRTIGSLPSETGGILGIRGNRIDEFFFDETPNKGTKLAYSPNHVAINKVLMEKWTPNSIVYMGAIHSHPIGVSAPSYGDELYVKRLFDHMLSFDKAKPYFYIAIVFSSADIDEFRMFSYIACYRNGRFRIEKTPLYIDGQKYEPKPISWKHDYKAQNRDVKNPYPQIDKTRSPLPAADDRNKSNYAPQPPPPVITEKSIATNMSDNKPMLPADNYGHDKSATHPSAMHSKTAICICGDDAMDYILALAGHGVGRFFIIDVSSSSDTFGKHLSSVKKLIFEVNPKAEVYCVNVNADEEITDDALLMRFGLLCKRSLENSDKNTLIVNLANYYYLNKSAISIASSFSVPYIKPNIFRSNKQAFITFMLPSTKTEIFKCFVKPVEGLESATDALSGIKVFLGLLLFDAKEHAQVRKHITEYAVLNNLVINTDFGSHGDTNGNDPIINISA